MVTFTLSQRLLEFAKSHAIHIMCARVVYVPTCQMHANFSFLHSNVLINMSTSQKCASDSTWHVNVPKACQFLNFTCQNGITIFQSFFKRIFQFLNFSIMLNISKFQELMGNSRKFIWQNKEFKFSHLYNFIKGETLST